MAIAAGTKDAVLFFTLIALVKTYAVNIGAAIYNGVHHLEMIPWHLLAETLNIFGAVSAKDLLNSLHFISPPFHD